VNDREEIEFVGGALDGVWREVGPYSYEYLVPVPRYVAEFTYAEVEPTVTMAQMKVHRYVRQKFGNSITGRRITKMVFVGEEWR